MFFFLVIFRLSSIRVLRSLKNKNCNKDCLFHEDVTLMLFSCWKIRRVKTLFRKSVYVCAGGYLSIKFSDMAREYYRQKVRKIQVHTHARTHTLFFILNPVSTGQILSFVAIAVATETAYTLYNKILFIHTLQTCVFIACWSQHDSPC